MLPWLALLMSHLFLNGAAADSTTLERIEDCHTSCSQGLNCKTKPDYWFHPACQDPVEGFNNTSVFHNISLSTVMKCERKQKCALHLRIKTSLQLAEPIHGVSFCTSTAGMITNCRNLHFTKASRSKMSGKLVTVENDCTEVAPNQRMQITVRTIPSYCGITMAGTYNTPGCINEDLRENVPECITGRLSYDINPEKKELKINVSDMLEDHDYHLRLCHKNFICTGTGASTLIKKEQPIKSAVLSYLQPLPCLCIEGWSAVMDAPRVQVCPFKDRLEELWSGISFDPVKETLLWTPACSVTAVAGLCDKREDDVCVDLPHSSQNVSREKITFAKVDPHPQLCIRFTSGSQSWTRCPFADGIKVWGVDVTTRKGHEVQIFSQITAKFSVGWCMTSEGSPACKTSETRTVHVEKLKAVDLMLAGESCNSCLQVKRLDVKYAATVVHCFKQCSQTTWDLTWVVLPAAVCLSGIIIVTLVVHIMLNVYQRRKQKNEVSVKQKDSALDSVVSALHTQPVFVHDLQQCGSNEKANLIS
ncbi:putative interleukin-17 receptor E-like [Melanotaenia boesemani]|uniref:putative interleukin-17 receptor E-like n=1 Tax=Melanotaenia boesemani TaxID=1250792 RepID=UPI001C03EBF2|nr:putative interleukin-17 receptor E-like [Melanotaenia boesemani]